MVGQPLPRRDQPFPCASPPSEGRGSAEEVSPSCQSIPLTPLPHGQGLTGWGNGGAWVTAQSLGSVVVTGEALEGFPEAGSSHIGLNGVSSLLSGALGHAFCVSLRHRI